VPVHGGAPAVYTAWNGTSPSPVTPPVGPGAGQRVGLAGGGHGGLGPVGSGAAKVAVPGPLTPQAAIIPATGAAPHAAGQATQQARQQQATQQPAGVVVPVVAAHPQAGASGVALAMADAAAAAGLSVLLVDCADPRRSGLAGVASHEGPTVAVPSVATSGGWAVRVSTRAPAGGRPVRVLRVVAPARPWTAADLPTPAAWVTAAPGWWDLTVVDLGWDAWHLLAGPESLGPMRWLSAGPQPTNIAPKAMPSPPLPAVSPVLVVRATAPSLAAAEGVLARYLAAYAAGWLAEVGQVAVVGASGWPPGVLGGAGRLARLVQGREQFVPWASSAAVAGWSTAPVPPVLRDAGKRLLLGVGGRVGAAVGPVPKPPRRGWWRRARYGP
jgi:hypothetical protein